MPKKDINQTAFSIMRQATGEEERPAPFTEHQEASRKGGLKGGDARAAKLPSEERKAIAKKAAEARWKKC